MIGANRIRTDLAMEVRESFEKDNVEIKGVILEKEYDEEKDIHVTTVIIRDQEGAEAMSKPIGTYITIEADRLRERDEKNQEKISEEISRHLGKLLGKPKGGILVAGLGNREVTPDALGPWVIDQLMITRHVIREFGADYKRAHNLANVSALAPGVMAQTGMESLEILKGIIRETKPEKIIVIDALASRSINRLNTTIQLTDTGICPGSGVGNNRQALNKESLGIDVIALGVPTVVDAGTIVRDTMELVLEKQGFEREDIGMFLTGLSGHEMENMFVTPKDIDESMRCISDTISEALNRCFSAIYIVGD